MDYYKKYLKYKKKYIQQKLLYGGSNIYNFENINYVGCTETDNKNTHCDSVDFTINNVHNEKKNVNWNRKYNNQTMDIGVYNNNNSQTLWNRIPNGEKIVSTNTLDGKKTHKSSLIKTAIVETEYFNYDNIRRIDHNNINIENENKLRNIIKDNIIIFNDENNNIGQRNSTILQIKKLLVIENQDNLTIYEAIKKNLEDIKQISDDCDKAMENKTVFMFKDGFNIKFLYIYYIKEENKAIFICNMFSIYTIIFIELFGAFLHSTINEIMDIMLLKFIIENLQLKVISKNFKGLSGIWNFIDEEDTSDLYIVNRNYDLLINIKYYDVKNQKLIDIASGTEMYKLFIIFTNIDNFNWEHDNLCRPNLLFYEPICSIIEEYCYFDVNNLKIFKNKEWSRVEYYIAWAYSDFISNNYDDMTYSSFENENNIFVYGIDNNIKFTLKKNEYGVILYKDSIDNYEYLICDNEVVRRTILMVSDYYANTYKYYTGGYVIPEILNNELFLNNNSLRQLLYTPGVKDKTTNTYKIYKMFENTLEQGALLDKQNSFLPNDEFPLTLIVKYIPNSNKPLCNIEYFLPQQERINNYLDIIYENALLISVLYNLLLKHNHPCYLRIIINKQLSEKALTTACDKINILGFLIPEIYLIEDVGGTG